MAASDPLSAYARERGDRSSRLTEEAHRRLQNAIVYLAGIFARFFLQIVQIRAAERAADGIKVEGNVHLPRLIERLQNVSADRAALRAARTLVFPRLGQQGIDRLGGELFFGALPALAQQWRDPLTHLLEPAVLHQPDVLGADAELRGDLAIGPLRVKDQLQDLELAEIQFLLKRSHQPAERRRQRGAGGVALFLAAGVAARRFIFRRGRGAAFVILI